jgi:putative MFS transporter
MELTTSTYATLVGNIALVAFAFGEIVVAGMAYLCRHWLLLKWAMTLYVLVVVPYLFFVPESPYWLLTKSRYDELEKLLRQIARFNQRSDSRWFPFYRYLIENHRKQKDSNQKNKIQLSFFAKLYRFLTHIPTMSKLFVSGLLGFVTLLLYFKISYSLGAMDEIDPYLNIIIGAVVEAIGYIVPSLFMIRYGRKPVMILFLIPVSICLLITPLTFNQNRWIIILIAQFGKFAISGAVGVTYIFVPELFPTSMRATGMGFFILFSRLGSITAPIIDSMINYNRSLTTYMYYVYTGLTMLCVLLTLLLPETRNVPLADKIDYNKKKNLPSIQSITRS